MNREEALQVARNYLDDLQNRDRSLGELVIEEQYMRDHEKAWAVVFNSREYLDNDNPSFMLFPNALIIPKDGSGLHYAPTDMKIQDYLDSL